MIGPGHTTVSAAFVIPFQEGVVPTQIHGRYFHTRCLGQRGDLSEQRSHGLFAQGLTPVEQLGQSHLDTAFAFLAGQV